MIWLLLAFEICYQTKPHQTEIGIGTMRCSARDHSAIENRGIKISRLLVSWHGAKKRNSNSNFWNSRRSSDIGGFRYGSVALSSSEKIQTGQRSRTTE
ncbi:uncharacterized protein LOC122530815 isoform X3 [Frieseomelitta varia]|uniref:uncharacterized protein LOC122530815 isoform X3 n=1 Tax=Frieseomelitta varia TaxID=561572 RepID=UPI001CB6992A|nr:uncharacterized protein LOC122530815 isoform X3 [Frieseomelitta varia]